MAPAGLAPIPSDRGWILTLHEGGGHGVVGLYFRGGAGGERCGGAVYSVRGGRSSGPGSGPRELIPNRRVPAAGIVGPPAAEVLAGPGAIGRWRVGGGRRATPRGDRWRGGRSCRRVGLPVVVVAPAGDGVVGPYGATMAAAVADSLEGPGRRGPIVVPAPAGDRVVGPYGATMVDACADSLEGPCRRVGLPVAVEAPAGDGVVGPYGATMAAACADSLEGPGRRGPIVVPVPIDVRAPAGDRVVGPYGATMEVACADSLEGPGRSLGPDPAPAGDRVVGPYGATMAAACADSLEGPGRRVGLPRVGLPEAPAGDGVVGADRATMAAAVADSLEGPGRRVGLPGVVPAAVVRAPAGDRVVGPHGATMAAACADRFERGCTGGVVGVDCHGRLTLVPVQERDQVRPCQRVVGRERGWCRAGRDPGLGHPGHGLLLPPSNNVAETVRRRRGFIGQAMQERCRLRPCQRVVGRERGWCRAGRDPGLGHPRDRIVLGVVGHVHERMGRRRCWLAFEVVEPHRGLTTRHRRRRPETRPDDVGEVVVL